MSTARPPPALSGTGQGRGLGGARGVRCPGPRALPWWRVCWGGGLGRTGFHCLHPQGERATGFGVALLLALFGQASEDPLLNLVSPLGCEVDAQEGDAERDSKRRRLV